MALDPRYWVELEEAGVRDEHLRMLVLMLRAMGRRHVGRSWRYRHTRNVLMAYLRATCQQRNGYAI